jgi:hypothetical protein
MPDDTTVPFARLQATVQRSDPGRSHIKLPTYPRLDCFYVAWSARAGRSAVDRTAPDGILAASKQTDPAFEGLGAVGIAIGDGTDVAIETADVVLMRSDPLDVATAVTIGRGTVRKMRQNLGWAIGYNSLALPIAASVFEPWGLTLRPSVETIQHARANLVEAAVRELHLRLDADRRYEMPPGDPVGHVAQQCALADSGLPSQHNRPARTSAHVSD